MACTSPPRPFPTPALRNVIGEIGVTHIRGPKLPLNIRNQHTNFNGFFTTVLIGIVDVHDSFLWFESGAPGSLRDDAVLKKTSLYRQIQAEQQQKNEEISITSTTKAKTSNNKGKGKGNDKDKRKRKDRPPPQPPQPGENGLQALAGGACFLGNSAFVERTLAAHADPRPVRSPTLISHRHVSLRDADADADAARDKFPGGAPAFDRLEWLFECLECLMFGVERGPVVVNARVVLHNFFLAQRPPSAG